MLRMIISGSNGALVKMGARMFTNMNTQSLVPHRRALTSPKAQALSRPVPRPLSAPARRPLRRGKPPQSPLRSIKASQLQMQVLSPPPAAAWAPSLAVVHHTQLHSHQQPIPRPVPRSRSAMARLNQVPRSPIKTRLIRIIPLASLSIQLRQRSASRRSPARRMVIKRR